MQPPNSKRIPRHSAILLSLLSIVTTSAQTDPELPAETLHWDLTALEQDSGAVWSTATFQTLRGALYHLQSSPNLGEWQSVNSFYAIGSELQIALFESEPATVPLGGGNPPEPAEVIPFVSFMIRASADGTQTIVTWPSVSPDSEASPSVSALISAPPVAEWSYMPIYGDQHGDYYFYLANLSQSVDPSFTATPPSLISPEDQAVLTELSSNFASIQQTVQTNVQNGWNQPVPPPAHPDAKRFYRLLRTFPDSDGDGISDYFEFNSGNDPFDEDENNDGQHDGDEDPDGDGLTNQDEELLGTNPNKSDSNDDGILDGETHQWFIFSRSYNFHYSDDEEDPEGLFGYGGHWNGGPSGGGPLTQNLSLTELNTRIVASVPFPQLGAGFAWQEIPVFSNTDNQIGHAGLQGSSNEGSSQASLTQARIVARTPFSVPKETSFPALLWSSGSANSSQPGASVTGIALTIPKDSDTTILDLLPTFNQASPEQEGRSQTLIQLSTRPKTHQTGFDNYPRLLDDHLPNDEDGLDQNYSPRPWLMVPSDSDSGNTFVLGDKDSQLPRLQHVDVPLTAGGGASVTPASTSNKASVTIKVKGPATGQTATLDVAGVPVVNLAFYPKRTIKLTVHVITMINDDHEEGNIAYGKGLPNQVCVTKGSNSTVLWALPKGDDDYTSDGNGIHTGPDGICQTPIGINHNNPSEADTEVIKVGNGKPDVVFITGGPNGLINTPTTSELVPGADKRSPDNSSLHTGDDGIRDTPIVNPALTPKNTPAAQELEDFLNEVYGLQANIYYQVTLNQTQVAFDVGHTDPSISNFDRLKTNGIFDIITDPNTNSDEEKAMNAGAFDQSADLNLYFLPVYFRHHTRIGDRIYSRESPRGWADAEVRLEQRAYIRALGNPATKEILMYIAAHEVGHLKLPNNSLGLDHPYKRKNPLVAASTQITPNPIAFPLWKKSDNRRRLMWLSADDLLPNPSTGEPSFLLIKPEWDILHGYQPEN